MRKCQDHRTAQRGRSAVLTVALVALCAISASAAEMRFVDPVQSEDQDAFGSLDQHAVAGCGNLACGPAAAVNSFVFLQNTYPELFGTRLVPTTSTNGHPTQQEMAAVGNTLATSMGCCNTTGTPVEKFITAKMAYLDPFGAFDYAAEIAKPWNTALGGSKPSSVVDNINPSGTFLAEELMDGEDVELLLDVPATGFPPTGGLGHYVTLTGLNWDDTGANFLTERATGPDASVDFIDPSNGKPNEAVISQSGNDPISITWQDPVTQETHTGTIFAAISESPHLERVPEPSNLWVFGVGVAIAIGVSLRARRPRPEPDQNIRL